MSRRPKLINPLLALAALAAVAIGASGCGTTSADVDRGRTLFIEKCGTCHAMAEAGTAPGVGPNLDHAFAAARAVGQDSDTVEGIVKGQVEFPRPGNGNPSASMPADIVTGQDLDDVAAYVGKFAGVPGAAPPEVPGGPGAQVFANSGCAGCHTLAAANAGGTVGPDLDESLKPGTSASLIEQMIVDPDAEVPPGYSAGVMPTIFGEQLSKKELEDLIQYLLESTPAGKGQAAGG